MAWPTGSAGFGEVVLVDKFNTQHSISGAARRAVLDSKGRIHIIHITPSARVNYRVFGP